MKNFDRKYLIAAVFLSATTFVVSIWLFPEWTLSGRALVGLAVAVIIGVVGFLAAARQAFEKPSAPIPNFKLQPEPKPSLEEVPAVLVIEKPAKHRLRLKQTAGTDPDTYNAEINFDEDGQAPRSVDVKFSFKLFEQDHKDLRWYLEDFLQYPLDPAPKVAERVEKRISEIGAELFKAVFQANDDARDLWATLRDKLDDTRVEIITEIKQATAIPWELIRDPKTDVPLALRAQAFVRAQPNPAQKAILPKEEKKIRILLVICRPGKADDVPFRSVASRLIKGLSESDRETFQLDVLRPPTFDQLAKVLREAKAEGTPYHVVHFDGHGMYLESKEGILPSQILRGLMPMMLTGEHSGSHGYLVFENPKLPFRVNLSSQNRIISQRSVERSRQTQTRQDRFQ